MIRHPPRSTLFPYPTLSRSMPSEHRIETPQHQMGGGRFALGPSEALHALNRSLPVDHRLWPQDVTASKAWVHALGRLGVLAPAEEAALLDGLDRVAERLPPRPPPRAPAPEHPPPGSRPP